MKPIVDCYQLRIKTDDEVYIDDMERDSEGRVITRLTDGFYFVNAYMHIEYSKVTSFYFDTPSRELRISFKCGKKFTLSALNPEFDDSCREAELEWMCHQNQDEWVN